MTRNARLAVSLMAVAILLILAAVLAQGGNAQTPYGHDGAKCHGANRESCRPDPQPSHGQDCLAHGANRDGNDDHCGPTAQPSPSASPTVRPSASPSPRATPSVTPSQPAPSPSPTPSPTPSPVPQPRITLPPTDTK